MRPIETCGIAAPQKRRCNERPRSGRSRPLLRAYENGAPGHLDFICAHRWMLSRLPKRATEKSSEECWSPIIAPAPQGTSSRTKRKERAAPKPIRTEPLACATPKRTCSAPQSRTVPPAPAPGGAAKNEIQRQYRPAHCGQVHGLIQARLRLVVGRNTHGCGSCASSWTLRRSLCEPHGGHSLRASRGEPRSGEVFLSLRRPSSFFPRIYRRQNDGATHHDTSPGKLEADHHVDESITGRSYRTPCPTHDSDPVVRCRRPANSWRKAFITLPIEPQACHHRNGLWAVRRPHRDC